MLNRFLAFLMIGLAGGVLGCQEQPAQKIQSQSDEPKTESTKPVREEAKKVPGLAARFAKGRGLLSNSCAGLEPRNTKRW
jgi:hypothetical protein